MRLAWRGGQKNGGSLPRPDAPAPCANHFTRLKALFPKAILARVQMCNDFRIHTRERERAADPERGRVYATDVHGQL